MSSSDESDQRTNVPPRNGTTTDPTDFATELWVPPPRIEPQSTNPNLSGHQDRSNLRSANRHRSSYTITMALLRDHALEQARHEAVLAEIAATVQRAQQTFLNPLPPIRDIYPQQQQQPPPQQAIWQQLLRNNPSFTVPPLLSHAASASVNNNDILQSLQLLPQPQPPVHNVGIGLGLAAWEERLPAINAMFRGPNELRFPASSSFLVPSAIRDDPQPVAAPPRETDAGEATAPRQVRRRARRRSHIPSTLSLPVSLARPSDAHQLTAFQCLLREQIEAFAATEADVETHVRGRNKPITVGQVGIRCRHCAHIPVRQRQKGASYFPSNTYGIYQAAQSMATAHFAICSELAMTVKERLLHLQATARAGAGRSYWRAQAQALGLVDTDDDRGIRFVRDVVERGAAV